MITKNMKQHITKKQWKELKDEEMKVILKFTGFSKSRLLSIIQMIEFLGDDLDSIENMQGSYIVYDKEQESVEKNELCDALWYSCKIKIANTNNKKYYVNRNL